MDPRRGFNDPRRFVDGADCPGMFNICFTKLIYRNAENHSQYAIVQLHKQILFSTNEPIFIRRYCNRT